MDRAVTRRNSGCTQKDRSRYFRHGQLVGVRCEVGDVLRVEQLRELARPLAERFQSFESQSGGRTVGFGSLAVGTA